MIKRNKQMIIKKVRLERSPWESSGVLCFMFLHLGTGYMGVNLQLLFKLCIHRFNISVYVICISIKNRNKSIVIISILRLCL